MNIEIVETPVRFRLHGIAGAVENERYGEVGLRLMNEMWQTVKGAEVPTTGVNHWVYLPGGRMFVGVEVRHPEPLPALDPLEPLEFELQRYMKHVHVGPYQALPQKWADLKVELAARGEVIGSPSLEMYGHHCDDSSKQEATILIGPPGEIGVIVSGWGNRRFIPCTSSSHQSFGPSPTTCVVADVKPTEQ